MAIENYQGKKYCGEKRISVADNLVIEQALQININEKTFSITMRTPGNDEDLIRGLLYSEDIYKSKEPLHISFIDNKEKGITEAAITIPENLLGDGYSNSRNLLSVSSCGICGKTELEEISSLGKMHNETTLNINDIFRMFKAMNDGQPTFHQSGGSHAAAAFSKSNELFSIREDIGRHNAVDKVIGHLANESRLKDAKCLIVSGRISYEIVTKAFAANIPVLAAVSAPSSLAVDFAKELGITILGFCRDRKATCYANPQRIV
ncbi:MAG: formate dehydrogenase accessory sulfurtransferase FdhD [Vicingaceae bacterium]